MSYHRNPDAEMYGRDIRRRISQIRLIIVPPVCSHTSTPYISIRYYNPDTDEEDWVETNRCGCLAEQSGHHPDAVDVTIDIFPGMCCAIEDPVVVVGLQTLFRVCRRFSMTRPCRHRGPWYQP